MQEKYFDDNIQELLHLSVASFVNYRVLVFKKFTDLSPQFIKLWTTSHHNAGEFLYWIYKLKVLLYFGPSLVVLV